MGMTKKDAPTFTSKTSEEMYHSLEGHEEGHVPVTPRRVVVMDPYGPFRGDFTRDRVDSMMSNVEMEDVSGAPRMVNVQEVPKHPVFKGSTREEKRAFIQERFLEALLFLEQQAVGVASVGVY